MQNNAMKDWIDSSYLASSNRLYIEKLYNKFLVNPNSVDQDWKLKFESLSSNSFIYQILSNNIPNDDSFANYNFKLKHEQDKILKLINDFRLYGHQHAKLDPLGLWQRKNLKNLHLSNYGFVDSDSQKIFNIDCFSVIYKNIKLIDFYNLLKKIYCDSIGLEYMHITNINEIHWIQQQVESVRRNIDLNVTNKTRLLYELIIAESIEHYLGMKFPAAKRFSLEGSDVLIPILKEMIRESVNYGLKEIVIGMAHRGRLNVLANIFGKSSQKLFDEFTNENINECDGSGDVKYHMGFASDMQIGENLIHLLLMFNPSHLEVISPVVMGSVRAHIDESIKYSNMILPIILHGDASICGQGIVQETFNMSKVKGYDVGGSIHIVINNQIGFTTSNIEDIRSTEYCTDIAKMVNAPIFHVNADDPEAAIFVAHLALKFRNIFKKDVIIDLVSYRRHGHNEADEPSATQPLMYRKINQHPSVCKIYSDKLRKNDIIKDGDVEKILDKFISKLDKGDCLVQECKNFSENLFSSQNKNSEPFYTNYPDKIEINSLQKLARQISIIPDDIEMHPRVSKIYYDRYNMAQGKIDFDWGAAETLAYATILSKKISIRLSGEDSARGTFFHRHAVIHDQQNDRIYVPLQHISQNQGIYYILDSVLSEEATLAFEYGYASSAKNTLVIWEAQFGDFSNGAQIVIDQFISSSEQKWRQTCNLVMLLPHGYEGQGPEHSSARLERYLQLCAENNMQICVPSTAAQFYHLLRRQAICNIRKPLIIMTPKSLLRHSIASSSIKNIVYDIFKKVIEEVDNNIIPDNVIQIIICTGKIYYDLLNKRSENKQCNIAILRIEQLYPFPLEELKNILFLSYSHVKKIIWCQEEPKNQGAWYYCHYYFQKILSTNKNILLSYVGRPASAATATGFSSIHQKQQKKIVDNALNID